MNKIIGFSLLLCLTACQPVAEDRSSGQADSDQVKAERPVSQQTPAADAIIQCDQAWFAMVESILNSGDGQGHGPDLGSLEWQSVIEFKLGIRGNSDIPEKGTDAWCAYISKQLPQ